MIQGMFLLFTFTLIQGVQSDTVGDFEGLKNAIAANAGTITVNANIAWTERIEIAAGKSVTIQASGAVVFDAAGSNDIFFIVLNDGELHITGITMQNVCSGARANVVESVCRPVPSTRFAPEHFRLHFHVRQPER